MKRQRLLLRAVACLLLVSATVSVAPAADEAGEELVQLIVGLLQEKDKDLRAVGLEQVRSEAKGQAATKRFALLLPKLTPDAQVGLLSALADRGDAAARPAVLELLAAARDESVKVAAVEALGLLGESADLKLLVPLLSSASKAEKAVARASLVKLRGESAPAAIAAEMKQAPTQLRVTLIEILADRRALDTVPDILAAAVADDPLVRGAAMTALGQLAAREHIAGMVQGVLKAAKGAEREAAEKAIMIACGRTADAEKRAEPLLAAMQNLSEADRLAMLPTLGRVGSAAALKIIEEAIASQQPNRHEIGIRALCNWPASSIAPRLIELAKTDTHPEHRTMTLAALIRVAPLPDKRSASERLQLLQTALGMCTRLDEQNLVLKRARAIRTVETLRFIMPYVDKPSHAADACETVVELAHHRELREPNKAEFDRALDKVIATSKDAVVVERANRYKKGQTWAKPAAPEKP